MVPLKRMMKITPPKMGESMVMMMTMVPPSGREVPPVELCPPEGTIAPAQVSPRDGGASSRKSSPNFSRSGTMIYQKEGLGGLLG
jgi:hypothetical protein